MPPVRGRTHSPPVYEMRYSHDFTAVCFFRVNSGAYGISSGIQLRTSGDRSEYFPHRYGKFHSVRYSSSRRHADGCVCRVLEGYLETDKRILYDDPGYPLQCPYLFEEQKVFRADTLPADCENKLPQICGTDHRIHYSDGNNRSPGEKADRGCLLNPDCPGDLSADHRCSAAPFRPGREYHKNPPGYFLQGRSCRRHCAGICNASGTFPLRNHHCGVPFLRF